MKRAKPSNLKKGAVDYRRHIFFKILYNETDSPYVPMYRGYVVMVTFTLMMIGCSTSVPISTTMERRLDNLKGFLLELMVCLVAFNECTSRPKMQRLTKYIERCSLKSRYNLPEEDGIMANAQKDANFNITFYMLIFAVNFPLMMVTKPIEASLDGKAWKHLPFPWEIYPLDNDMYFYSLLVFHTFGVAFSHCCGITAMCHVTTITGQIIALFDVVILGADKMDERVASKMGQSGLSWEQSMLACLQESIAHHQEILRELRLEKPQLEFIHFASTLCLSISMACEAFPLIQEHVTLFIAAKGGVFLLVQMVSSYVINDRIEKLADRNTELFRALYGTQWYKCGARTRRIVLNGLTFSQHSLMMSAWRFLGLTATRATFYSAMINAFNVLSMLRKMM